MKKQSKHSIIISGGGTGGHIFPAIAIAQELTSRRPDLEILFVGAVGKMEMEKVPKAGYPIIGLPITAFHRRVTVKNLLFPFKLLISLVKANRLIKNQNPLMVIGTGGFASGPVMKAAVRHKIPVVIQEQNAFPGVTNRLVAQKAELICVAHVGLDHWFPKDKILITGNPVRKDLSGLATKKSDAFDLFGLESGKQVVLLFGGSLGALALNEAVYGAVDQIENLGVQFIWQTGAGFIENARNKLSEIGAQNIQAHAFIERMDLAYAAADIVISRAGAITLSELAIAMKPCILVPYPAAAGDHQMKNALAYKSRNAALVIENKNVKAELLETLRKLMNDKDAQSDMAKNLAALALPAASESIVDEILKILERN